MVLQVMAKAGLEEGSRVPEEVQEGTRSSLVNGGEEFAVLPTVGVLGIHVAGAGFKEDRWQGL